MSTKRTKKATKALSPKQELFCREYLVDLNATQAAIRAGYSKNTAYSQGQRLLKNVEVKKRIDKLMAERAERIEITADNVLDDLVAMRNMDIIDILDDDGNVKPISDWPKVWRQNLAGMDISEIWSGSGKDRKLEGILRKMKWPDPLKNIELIGKHTNVNAFKETVDHNHKGEVTAITRRIIDPKKRNPAAKAK